MPTFEQSAAVESLPIKNVRPSSEIVEAFRADLDREFVRFQNLYDRSNVAMRNYRLAHVALVTSVYNRLLTVFGDDLGAVYTLMDSLQEFIEAKTTEVGSVNPCIQGIIDQQAALSVRVSTTVQQCALAANTTLNAMLADHFYPTFIGIQSDLTEIPLSVIDVLSRGNVLNDEQAILDLLRNRYETMEFQWLNFVSQLLRWETERFEIEGLFIVDENTICLADALIDLIFNYSTMQNELRDC